MKREQVEESDISELRRLAQAATPGPWKLGQYLGSPRQFVIHMDVGDKGRGSDVAFTSTAFGNDETIANASFIAAANPAIVIELLSRLEDAESDALEQARLNGMGGEREAALMAKLEAAEKDIALKERIIDSLGSALNAVANERDALQAKVEAMEKQEPVAWLHESRRDSDVVTSAVKHVWGKAVVGALAAYSIPLYLATGAKGE